MRGLSREEKVQFKGTRYEDAPKVRAHLAILTAAMKDAEVDVDVEEGTKH